MKASKPTWEERLNAVPPPPPKTIAYINKLRMEQDKKRPSNGGIENIVSLQGAIAPNEGRKMIAYVEYSRGHITEEEFDKLIDELT